MSPTLTTVCRACPTPVQPLDEDLLDPAAPITPGHRKPNSAYPHSNDGKELMEYKYSAGQKFPEFRNGAKRDRGMRGSVTRSFLRELVYLQGIYFFILLNL